MINSEILDPEWLFQSRIQTPNGVEVEVTIRVPESSAGSDVGELAEVAQMTCSAAMRQARSAGNSTASAVFQ